MNDDYTKFSIAFIHRKGPLGFKKREGYQIVSYLRRWAGEDASARVILRESD